MSYHPRNPTTDVALLAAIVILGILIAMLTVTLTT